MNIISKIIIVMVVVFIPCWNENGTVTILTLSLFSFHFTFILCLACSLHFVLLFWCLFVLWREAKGHFFSLNSFKLFYTVCLLHLPPTCIQPSPLLTFILHTHTHYFVVPIPSDGEWGRNGDAPFAHSLSYLLSHLPLLLLFDILWASIWPSVVVVILFLFVIYPFPFPHW